MLFAILHDVLLFHDWLLKEINFWIIKSSVFKAKKESGWAELSDKTLSDLYIVD